MINEILICLLILLLMLHYTGFLFRVRKGLGKLRENNLDTNIVETVSVIVPFRNEEKNILRCLNSLETQDYPSGKFEIIFADDFSTDNSFTLLKQNKKYPLTKVIQVPEDYSINAHKKRAIRYGIENSSGSIIVTTDADCYHHPSWLRKLVTCMDQKTGFVAGPVEFAGDESFFGKLQKLEFSGLVITGAGLIGAGTPTICNAANIAYRKSAFDMVNGFSSQLNLSSGDDELLMQKISKETDYKVKFCTDTETIVKTEPNENVHQFYNQRKRWASKGLFYADRFLIARLILIFLFYLSLITLPLIYILTLNSIFLYTFMVSFLVKILSEYLVLARGYRILFSDRKPELFFIAQIFHIPYIIIAGASGVFGNLVWKDRKIKR